MTIAVTGSNGHLGRLVIERLRTKLPTSEIVGIARSPAKAADLRVAIREGDYADPSTLESALDGIRDLVLISSNEFGQRAVQHRNVIAAAKKAGVRRVMKIPDRQTRTHASA